MKTKNRKNTLKVVYTSLWDTATPEQRKESLRRIDEAYEVIFNEVDELYFPHQVNGDRKTREKPL